MAAPKAKPGTAVVKWEEELAKQAQIAAKMEENTGSSNFFGLKSGILTYNSQPLANNEMAVVIIDHIQENVFYEGKYDPDTPQGPICYAFGRDEKDMAPHAKVVEAHNDQHATCAGCPMNEWGTADTGRGKACRNVRRLAMLPAGSFDKNGKFEMIMDAEHYEKAVAAFMKLSLTSVKGYAAFVKQVATALKRPPFGIFTKVKVVPDPDSQFKVTFEALSSVPDSLMPVIMARHEEVASMIDFPYTDVVAEDGGAKKGKTVNKKPVNKRPPVKKGPAKY